MIYLLFWWLLLVVAGLAAFPIAFRYFPGLADRGYAFAKPLALLLLAYPFWLLTSFGLLQNTFGAIATVLVILTVAAWAWRVNRPEEDSALTWLRKNWRYALVLEAVFAVAFFAFAYYRAFNPEIQATEKPMEFMLLNSILQSVRFPPHDAWLSGFAISYYYLGYVIVALLTRLTDVPSSYSFNLALIMVYALSASGVFGLVYNLIRHLESPEGAEAEGEGRQAAPIIFGVIAAFLLLVSGNLEAPFESLHNAGIGSEGLYKFLDINGLAEVPPSGTFVPSDNWWWWRASRVVNDHDPVTGAHIEVIDEFPSFSFLLGDLHPHVLALPFGLLALAVAFNLVLRPPPIGASLATFALGWLKPGMLLTAIVLGSLSMLNTWDIVTYGFILVGAFGLGAFRSSGARSRPVLVQTAVFGIALFAVAILLYLPFYFGFSSQAGGILPTIIFKTPLQQYLMMFGLFIFILASLIVTLIWQRRGRMPEIFGSAATWVLTFFAVPVAIGLVGSALLLSSGDLRQRIAELLRVGDASQAVPTVLEVLRQYLIAFAYSLPLFLLLIVLMSCIIALVRESYESEEQSRERLSPLNASTVFVLLIALTGLALTFGVEFLYIRDTFGTRMNTVFKLYFQAWTLFSVAAGFGAYYVVRSLAAAARSIWVVAFGLVFALSLIFPLLAYPNRANAFQASSQAGIPTLDGTRWIESAYPDDFAAIGWLKEHAPAASIILEASGAQYSFYDRVSMATGLPTVVGWVGHELQWRGSGEEAGRRERDVEQIYKSTDAVKVGELLSGYGVNYVIVGSLEREKYGLVPPMVDKFAKLGELVFNQGSMRIYALNR